MSKTTIRVSNSTELQEALQSATGGEKILLEPGDYGTLELRNQPGMEGDFPSNVTITSAVKNDPATFSGMSLRDVSNLTIRGVVFDYEFEPGDAIYTSPFSVRDSSNIVIRNSTFDGDLASGISDLDDGFGYGKGLTINDSSGVIVRNNEFFDWHRGLVVSHSDDVVVAKNDVHSIRSDGMDFVSVQNVLIEDNYLHDFGGSLESPDHPDMIQFWTTGTDTPSRNIEIRGNTLDVGTGTPTQSIFMRNEVVDGGQAGSEMYYQNITIENNTIYNGHTHGITVGEVNGLQINNNTMIQTEGSEPLREGGVSVPSIHVKSVSTNVEITNNITGAVNGNEGQAGWQVSNNAIIQNTDPNAPGYYGGVFVTSSLESSDGINTATLLPDGWVDMMNTGSDAVQFDAAPDALTPLYLVSSLDGESGTLVFDGSLTMDAGGPVDLATATFTWYFGDGTKSEGPLVQRDFSEPGVYDVTLVVTTADGESAVEKYSIAVAGDDIVSLNNAGKFVSHGYGETGNSNSSIENRLDTDGEPAIILGGTGAQAIVSRDDIKRVFGADNFTAEFSIKATAGGASDGEVFGIHSVLKVLVNSDGNIALTTYLEDGSLDTSVSSGVSLLDGLSHDVKIVFDADLGTVDFFIDGALSGSAPVHGDLKNDARDLTFGNQFGHDNFTGELTEFSLSSTTPDYTLFGGSQGDINTVIGEDHGALVNSIDGLILDISDLDSQVRSLKGDVEVIASANGPVISLDGDGDQVRLGKLEQFEDSDQLSVSVDFQRSVADGRDVKVFWHRDTLGLRLIEDGVLVRVGGADGTFKKFEITNLGLNDTDIHNAVILVDGETDRLQVLIDGALIFEETDTDLDIAQNGGREYVWNLSGFKAKAFEGYISDFRIDTDVNFVEDGPAARGETDSLWSDFLA